MKICRCGHNEDDHREGVFECGASIIHQGAEFFCGCEDFEPAEPSTEGTQAAQPRFGFFRCLSCGFKGTISNDEIANHRVQCPHGPTVPMSQAEWEACGGPAPVAQVDAGKYDFAKVRSQHFTEIAEEYEPAVAQTELPPLTESQKWPYVHAMEAQVASLTQRLQASEAREAELKAEIAKMQMDNVIDYKAACEQHAANYEALERSHKALLEDKCKLIGSIIDRIDMAPNDDPVPYIREYVAHFISVTETGK